MGGAGGFKRTCKGLFADFANKPYPPDFNGSANSGALRHGSRTIAEITHDRRHVDRPLRESRKALGDLILGDMNALATGVKRPESTSATPPQAAEKQQDQVSTDYHTAAKSLDAELGSQPAGPRSTPKTRGRWRASSQKKAAGAN